MKLTLSRDYLNNPIPPRVFLCTTGKKVIGELPAINRQLNGKWNSYSEFSFEMQRTYVDILTGETKVHPLYDKVEAPRNILVEGLSYFSLQDIDDTSSDNDIKSVSSFSLEYATSNKYLINFHINTGEIDSKEVLFNEDQYGVDYNTDKDSFYKLASGDFDPYESYYQQVYTDTDSYIYEQVQIDDATEYAELIKANTIEDSQPHEKLYMKKFPNVQFYNNNPSKRGLSLLHLIFENIPEWQIGNVDQSLWRKERKFSEDRISVYDFLMNNVAETFGCTFVWDSLTGLVHAYAEVEDDEIENEASTRFETDVFISKDNLASECKVSYSSDNIKTKLVVTGSDNLDIREVNLGRNEIMDLGFYHTLDWMEQDLFEAYDDYLDELQEAQSGLNTSGNPSSKYPMSYPDAMKGWVSANNRWSDLMNEVPAEGNVVLIGDEFKKLYCTFSPINTAYCKTTIGSGTQYVETSALYLDEAYTKPIPTPTDADMYVAQGALLVYSKTNSKFKVDMEWDAKKFALIKKLNQYHVDEDTNANKQDNILLKLKNSASDVATIRVYDKRFEASSYDERLQYYTKDKNGKYSETNIVFKDATDFNTKKESFAKDGTTIWANDYYVHSIVVKASSGVSEAPDEYPIVDWIKSTLTAEKMDLNGYKITYIGTMGAYFVLAKDETIPDNLQDYGVRLLEEKHKTYTTIFQTQTEAMFSQEKAQCIVQDETPEGDYKDGTRWLDTNSNPIKLYQYSTIIESSLSQAEIEEMQMLQEGGNVNLFNRPQIPASKLTAVGWGDAGDGTATVFTSTYSNEDETIAINVTPIISGERIMSPDELESYALAIIYDGMEDYEKIQIGPIFKGANAVANAVVAAERIHELQDKYYLTENNVITKGWRELSGSVSPEDQADYENYQRYIDNYEKLVAVQSVLSKKEREAEYCLNGYSVPDRVIVLRPTDGSSLEENMHNAALAHFNGHTVTRESLNSTLPLYTFTTSFDPIVYGKNIKPYNPAETYYTKDATMEVYTSVAVTEESFKNYDGTTNDKTLYIQTGGHIFAVYLQGKTPYVAYANSQGVYQMIMEYIRDKTEMNKFFTVDQWIRLSPFIKEDEFNDSNFLLTGYESEEERIKICQELMDAADKELKTLCKPSLEFSMTMANILALPEFEPLFDQFQLGNFIKVGIRDGYVKRSRLLEVNMNFDNLSDFSCTFGNLVTTKSEIDKHADLLSQAVSAGKQVAKSSGAWQKSVDKTNKLEQDIANGLQDMALAVGSASGQAISWDSTGMHFRKYKDGSTTEFEPEEMAIINNAMVATNDSWRTSKTSFGKYTINGEERWGPIAEYVTADIIEGKFISGGSIEIGEGDTKFVVNADGSVEIKSGGTDYVNAMKEIDDAYRYQIVLTYDKSTIFSDVKDDCTITCSVYDYNVNITQKFIDNGAKFSWIRTSYSGQGDATWNEAHKNRTTNTLKITAADIVRNSTFSCNVEINETVLEPEEETI